MYDHDEAVISAATYDYNPMPKVLQLYLTISQFPVLSRTIRTRMREELFARGIISEEAFEREVLQKAIESQKREGLIDPLIEESPQDWDKRVRYIRAHLTDFYFAYNLPHALFEQILHEVLQQRVPERQVQLAFNPEIAPWDMLFAEGERLMQLPPDERGEGAASPARDHRRVDQDDDQRSPDVCRAGERSVLRWTI